MLHCVIWNAVCSLSTMQKEVYVLRSPPVLWFQCPLRMYSSIGQTYYTLKGHASCPPLHTSTIRVLQLRYTTTIVSSVYAI